MDHQKNKGLADDEVSHQHHRKDHQNPTEDFDWVQNCDLQDLFSDDIFDNRTFEFSRGLHEVLDPNVSTTLNQDQNIITGNEFRDLDPLEEISSWDSLEDGDSHWFSSSADCNPGGGSIGSSSAATTNDGDQKVAKRLNLLEFEDIEKYFEMPMFLAAKELGVGATYLKKRCRELNITRWPHRKLRSLQTMIQNAKELGLKDEMEVLAGQKRMMEKSPDMELTESTKKFRQACFKAVYRKRESNNP